MTKFDTHIYVDRSGNGSYLKKIDLPTQGGSQLFSSFGGPHTIPWGFRGENFKVSKHQVFKKYLRNAVILSDYYYTANSLGEAG